MTIRVSNTAPANGTVAMMTFFTLLMAYGHLVLEWDDGTPGNYHNETASPLMVNPFGGSGSGAGMLGNTGAFIRFRCPGAYEEWVVERGANDETWTVVRSRIAFTIGSHGARPTSAIEDIRISGACFAATPGAWNITLEDAAPYGWTAFTVVSGGGNVKTWLISEPLATGTYSPLDADPTVYAAFYDVTGFGPYALTVDNSSEARSWRKRIRHGMSSPDPTVGEAYLRRIVSTIIGCIAPPSSTQELGVDPYTGKEAPLVIGVGAKGAQTIVGSGYGGDLSRTRWATVLGRANGQTLYDSVSGKYFIYMMGMWVPWDSSIPVI